jgi:hypothetical protein
VYLERKVKTIDPVFIKKKLHKNNRLMNLGMSSKEETTKEEGYHVLPVSDCW